MGLDHRVGGQAGTCACTLPAAGSVDARTGEPVGRVSQLVFQTLLGDRRIPTHYGVAEFRKDLETLRQMEGR